MNKEESSAKESFVLGLWGVRYQVKDVSRIVVLNGDLAEVVYALGLGEKVVGVDTSVTIFDPSDSCASTSCFASASLNDFSQPAGKLALHQRADYVHSPFGVVEARNGGKTFAARMQENLGRFSATHPAPEPT